MWWAGLVELLEMEGASLNEMEGASLKEMEGASLAERSDLVFFLYGHHC